VYGILQTGNPTSLKHKGLKGMALQYIIVQYIIMPVKKSTIQRFKVFKNIAKPAYKDSIDEVIRLYENRNIGKEKEAENILRKIVGPKPESGVKLISKYTTKDSEKGKLLRQSQSKKTKQFFIRGKVRIDRTYIETRRGKETRKTYKDHAVEPLVETISARTREEAIEIYKSKAHGALDNEGYHKEEHVAGIDIEQVTDATALHSTPTKDVQMKACVKQTYDFIPSDDRLDSGKGFCVIDQFVGFYRNYIQKLDEDYFEELCLEFYGVSPLDYGLPFKEGSNTWRMEDGVSPACLHRICDTLNISCYGFDVTRKCFIKHVARSRNYPVLVYYCVNGHMYWITEDETVQSLVKRARDAKVNIKSSCIPEEKKKEDDREKVERVFLENIPIHELHNYSNATIICSGIDETNTCKTNLNDELDEIIKHYNYVPDPWKMNYKHFQLTKLHFNLNSANLILEIDPNDQRMMTWKIVQALCQSVNLEFTNQTFASLVKAMRDRFYGDKSVRKVFTDEERKMMYNDCPNCVSCNKKLTLKSIHIDHIIPLACGGTNEPENLQILCKKCHFSKTKEEHENGYVKLSQTQSSFNQQTLDIFTSSLSSTNAFVETLEQEIPAKTKASKVYNFDINRCRKNMMYYSSYESLCLL